MAAEERHIDPSAKHIIDHGGVSGMNRLAKKKKKKVGIYITSI